MMKSALGSGTDIHARPLPDCLQSFQNLDLICAIFRTCLRCHSPSWNTSYLILDSLPAEDGSRFSLS